MLEQLLGLESCRDYVKTPIQTLDGIPVHQPHRFLPLAKEDKKLAEALKKKQEKPTNQSKSLTDSDMSDDTEVNPRFKTSVEEREYNTIPGSATAT